MYIPLSFSQNSAIKFELKIQTKNQSIKNRHIKKDSLPLDRLSNEFVSDATKEKKAKQGDVLFFDNNKWIPAPLVGLNFIGGWNALENIPEILKDGAYKNKSGALINVDSGDYFVVSITGPQKVGNENLWSTGDWIIFNGTNWVKINNTGVISSIFGRAGKLLPENNDYTWEMIDKSKSKLQDLTDTPEDPTEEDNGKVLKWDKIENKWSLEKDQIGIAKGNVHSSDIIDGEIFSQHIAPYAEIKPAKIDNFEELANSKLNINGGQLSGSLNLQENDLVFGEYGTINGKNVTDFLNQLFNLSQVMINKEDKFIGSGNSNDFLSGSTIRMGEVEQRQWFPLSTNLAGEGNKKFFTNDRVLQTKLEDYQIGTNASLSSEDSILDAFGKLEQKIISFQENVVVGPGNIPDITLEDLSTNMGENSGLLHFGGSTWSLKMISGLQYEGEWDANENYPNAPGAGDYYIVSVPGNHDGKDWQNGDWAIYNGTSWLHINNSGIVYSFNNRIGNVIPCPGENCSSIYDYTWSMIGKSNSSINDLGDVDTSGVAEGQVLKWTVVNAITGEGKWAASDDLVGTGGGEISSDSIEEGSITNSDIAGDAAIKQTKVKDLVGDLQGKFPLSGGTLSGDLNLNNNNLIGVSNINGKNVNELLNNANTVEEDINSKENNLAPGYSDQFLSGNKNFVNFNSNNITEGANNLYITQQRVLVTPLANYSEEEGDNLSINEEDSLITAIGKLAARLKQQEIPTGSIGSEAIAEGSITVEKISIDSAIDGDTLIFNGSNEGWVLRPLSGMNYLGAWNVDANGQAPNFDSFSTPTVKTKGDYYIVSVGGTVDLGTGALTWSEGDWAVYNDKDGGEWQKISNSNLVKSFNNRVGRIRPESNDYKWDQLNFAGSSLNSIADVDTSFTAPSNGQVLKWISAVNKWRRADDDEKGAEILTGDKFDTPVILPQHFSSDSIPLAEVNQLEDELNSLYPLDGSKNLNRGLNLEGNNILNLTLLNGVNINELGNACNNLDPSVYQPKLIPDPSAENQFVRWPGVYTNISLDDLEGTQGNEQLYNSNNVLSLQLDGYVKNEAGASLGNGDTLLQAFEKLEGKIDNLASGGSAGFFEVSENKNLALGDNGKTFFVSGDPTEITLPNFGGVQEGYQVTVKRVDKENQVSNISITSNDANIDEQPSWDLNSNYASVKIIKEGNQWLIIQRHGEVQ